MFGVFLIRKIIKILQKITVNFSQVSLKLCFSQYEFWNIVAKSFKSTCAKVPVNLLKHITTHELLHKWLLKFSVRFFSPIYRSLFVSGKYILRSYLYSEAATRAVLLKRRVLRNFAKFTGKHMCQALFFNKVAGLNTFSYRAHPVAAFVYF